MDTNAVRIRVADRRDEVALLAMQAASFRALGRGYYSDPVIESFIGHVGTLDPALLDDGRYFVAQMGVDLVACGGWSLRTPRYAVFTVGGDTHPPAEPIVRAVYVSPRFARFGLGRQVMARIESEIVLAGHHAATLMATMSGAAFYERLGYRGAEAISFTLPDGLQLACIPLRKALPAVKDTRLAA